MKAPIEHIRVSAQAREQLIKLKRYTGIKNWNVLCRWAFCVSLTLKDRPTGHDIKSDSNIEMSWKVFAGEDEPYYLGLFIMRCRQDGIQLDDSHQLANEFRQHLHRGIALMASIRDSTNIGTIISSLVKD
jgi:DNA sulfur modification protein DndE